MRSSLLLGSIFAFVGAATMPGCGESPAVSPSAVSGVATLNRTGVAREEAPVNPATVTIGIVGSFGNLAYAPNPGQAAVGDQIVWTNNDQVAHRIVLDDGTYVGDVLPGASTPPIALKSATATYHCEIHPSMIGGINIEAAPAPPPPDYDYDRPDDGYGYGYGGY
jgi:plastocyanin